MNTKLEEAGKQKRLKGLTKATPDVNLSDYRFSAKIDTLVMQFKLDRKAKPGKLKEVIAGAHDGRDVFAKAHGWENKKAIGKGQGCDLWIVTIEDPTRKCFESVCDALRDAYGLNEGASRVIQMDVAVDAQVKGVTQGRRNTWESLQPIYDAMKVCHDPRAEFQGKWLRRRHISYSEQVERFKKQFAAGSLGIAPTGPDTWYWGDNASDWRDGDCKGRACVGVQWRLYYKIRDRNAELDENDRRVRFEVSLIQAGLKSAGIDDLVTLDDLREFDFKRLKPFFRFSIPCDDPVRVNLDKLLPAHVDASVQTVNYTELNRRVRRTLDGVK